MTSPLAALALAATLIDQSGHAFSLASLQGRPLAVTFVSTRCTDACPLIEAQFAQAAVRLAQRHSNVRLLTVGLDPRTDPPSAMRALAKRFDADPRYWVLASGRAGDLDRVLHAFGVVTQRGPGGDREAHTTFVYIFDARGRLQKTMLASSALSDDVVDAFR